MKANTGRTSHRLHSRPLSNTQLDRALFVDREEELETAHRSLQSEYNLLIAGHRGVGKTSFLYRLLGDTESKRHLCVLCDMAHAGPDTESFLDVLLHSLANQIQKAKLSQKLRKVMEDLYTQVGISVLGTSISWRKSDRSESRLQAKFDAMQSLSLAVSELSKGGHRITFFVDNLRSDPELIVELFGRYRDFLWQLDGNFVVTCDEPLLIRVWVPPLTSFFDVLLRLQPFSTAVTAQVLSSRLFDHLDTVDAIQALSQGNPRLALMLARRLAVGQTSREQLARAAARHADTVAELTETEREVYEHIRHWGAASASNEEFQQATGQQRARLTQILRALAERGLVLPVRHGKAVFYRLSDDLGVSPTEVTR
jgi:hypothetical protein